MIKQLTDCYLSKVEAARYLGRSTRWLDYQLIGPHPPPGFKLGKTWAFKKTELDQWLERFRAGSDLDRLVDATVTELRGGR